MRHEKKMGVVKQHPRTKHYFNILIAFRTLSNAVSTSANTASGAKTTTAGVRLKKLRLEYIKSCPKLFGAAFQG